MNPELVKINVHDQLFVNKKWFFDVIDVTDNKIKIRVKYKENINIPKYLYKTISLPKALFINVVDNTIYKSCAIEDRKLRLEIGGLVDRIAKEKNIYAVIESKTVPQLIIEDAIIEDAIASVGNTAGMGAVVNPGLSGIPGVPGAFGSGDLANSTFGNKTVGFEKQSPAGLNPLFKVMSKTAFKKKKKKKAFKEAIFINSTETINETDTNQILTDNDYKLKLYTFLDYPYDRDIEIDIINEISSHRAEFLNATVERIKYYLTSFYKINETLIKKNCTDNFINMLLVLTKND